MFNAPSQETESIDTVSWSLGGARSVFEYRRTKSAKTTVFSEDVYFAGNQAVHQDVVEQFSFWYDIGAWIFAAVLAILTFAKWVFSLILLDLVRVILEADFSNNNSESEIDCLRGGSEQNCLLEWIE